MSEWLLAASSASSSSSVVLFCFVSLLRSLVLHTLILHYALAQHTDRPRLRSVCAVKDTRDQDETRFLLTHTDRLPPKGKMCVPLMPLKRTDEARGGEGPC